MACAAATATVSMRGTRLSSRSSDAPICTLHSRAGFGGAVQVFASSADNSRLLQFQTDGCSAETVVKCQGPMPEACAAPAGDDCGPTVTCPCVPDGEVQAEYMKRMARSLVPMCNATGRARQDFRVLLIGLGGGALPDHILRNCPARTRVESVEYDPRVIEAATRFFGFREQPGVNMVEQGDGGEAVKARAAHGAKYDFVLVDAFESQHVPASCRSEEFVNGLFKILKPDGLAMQNIMTTDFDKTIDIYQDVFGPERVKSESFQFGVAHIISATARPPS